jgi:hypothetical protein
MGHNFCDAILDYCDPDQSKVKSILEELEYLFPSNSDDEAEENGSNESEGSGDESKKKAGSKKLAKKKTVKKKTGQS